MNTNQPMNNALDPVTEFIELAQRMEKTEDPAQEDLDRFRELAVSTPAVWSSVTQIMDSIRQQLTEKVSYSISRCSLLAEMDILKKQFGYETAPTPERLLIDHIMTARLRLIHAESVCTNLVDKQSLSVEVGEYWDNRLSSAHARYLKAIESLARVRKLARNSPPLQINIAQEGGKQINVQGDKPVS